VSTGAQAIKGATATQDAARDWQAVRAEGDIQFAPLPAPKPPEVPGWVEALARFVRSLLEPFGAIGWVLFWLLAAAVVAGLVYFLWRLVEPWFDRSPRPAPVADQGWVPDRDAALALLEDADRLAAEGRFDEATHLLLRRSVAQIAEARPDWVLAASTAREIAAIGALPSAAQTAFAIIATRVERSLFALRHLDAGDWTAAREAYAAFALERLPGPVAA
jgi:hypothetical protein